MIINFVHEPQREAQLDIIAEKNANIQRWLFALGFNAQLYHFNQELLRVAQRSNGDTGPLSALAQRWETFLAPYMAQHEAACKSTIASVVAVDHLTDIEVKIHA